MRVRIIRIFDEFKCCDVYVVQKWLVSNWTRPSFDGSVVEKPISGWDTIRDFELSEYEEACAFALHASLTKRPVTVVNAFDDGEVVPIENCTPEALAVDSAPTEVRPS